MRFSPHLIFEGQCEAAFRFYEQVFDGSVASMLTYGNSPMAEHVPLEWRDKIVHASLRVGDTFVVGADVLSKDYARPQGFYVLLEIAELVQAEDIFRALAEGGAVR